MEQPRAAAPYAGGGLPMRRRSRSSHSDLVAPRRRHAFRNAASTAACLRRDSSFENLPSAVFAPTLSSSRLAWAKSAANFGGIGMYPARRHACAEDSAESAERGSKFVKPSSGNANVAPRSPTASSEAVNATPIALVQTMLSCRRPGRTLPTVLRPHTQSQDGRFLRRFHKPSRRRPFASSRPASREDP